MLERVHYHAQHGEIHDFEYDDKSKCLTVSLERHQKFNLHGITTTSPAQRLVDISSYKFFEALNADGN